MDNPLQDPQFHQDPYPVYERLRAASPVQWVPTGSAGHGSYLVTGYAEAREAFASASLSKDAGRFFAGRASQRNLHPLVSQNMLASDPPQHTRLRRAVGPAFTPGRAARLGPFIGKIVDGILAGWEAGRQVDLVAALAVPLPVAVICELLGVPEGDRDLVAQWSDELFAAGRPDRIDAASHALAGYMTELVAAKRAAPDQALLSDLLSDLVAGGDDGRLTGDEVVSLAILLLVAGHETTTNLIGNALLALLENPGAAARLRAAPDLVPSALDELLRFDPPVGIATFRYSTEPFTLGGTDIPAGVPVLIAPGAANRDPAAFPGPDRLDLAREAAPHLAFGHGIHRCLGAPLARTETEIVLRALLPRFPGMQLALPADRLRWRRTRLMRGLASLPVRL
ncbi:cytochrome P450 [Streptomyces bambusae]|uniref:cytochrome P450 family protein n=1 Tax=Streptomyces bambusae TaxID=1550616 RepID=UPI001CFF693D|nr:cytochrome P450 [Streptomyces bambusae]MCB5169130.1 cytochrome P450 [Streptomyces bambusae]